jgi:hypothetical protein
MADAPKPAAAGSAAADGAPSGQAGAGEDGGALLRNVVALAQLAAALTGQRAALVTEHAACEARVAALRQDVAGSVQLLLAPAAPLEAFAAALRKRTALDAELDTERALRDAQHFAKHLRRTEAPPAPREGALVLGDMCDNGPLFGHLLLSARLR